jgi:hypothetical protein
MHAIPPNCGVPLRRWQRSLQVRVESWCEHKNIRRSCRARHRRREDEEDEGELREAHELPQPSDDTSGGRNHARTTRRRFGSNDLWWSLVLQVSDRRTRAAHKGTEIDNRSSTTPTVWNYFYLRKKENRRFLSFTLATSPATAGRRVTRNRWPAPRFLLTNCYTPGRPPSNGSTRLSRRNCRSRRDSRSALFLKEICPKVTRTYGSNYVYLRPHTWQQLHSFIFFLLIEWCPCSHLGPVVSRPIPRWLQLIRLYENGLSLINRTPRPICVASYQVYVYTYSCAKDVHSLHTPPPPLARIYESITLNFKKIKN